MLKKRGCAVAGIQVKLLFVQQGQSNEGNTARPQRVFVCTAHDTLR